MTADEAAGQLGIRASTARFQLRRVYDKLDIRRQSELVQLAQRLGRMQPD